MAVDVVAVWVVGGVEILLECDGAAFVAAVGVDGQTGVESWRRAFSELGRLDCVGRHYKYYAPGLMLGNV